MKLNKIYADETAARRHFEKLLWPEAVLSTLWQCRSNAHPQVAWQEHPPGVYKCNECEEPFSVTVGTVFERSHVPLHKWVYAAHLLTASKKGISSHQLSRMLGVSTKPRGSFASHPRRYAPGQHDPMGGSGQAVEADETYIGRVEGHPERRFGGANKNMVLTLVERGGSAR